MIAPPALKTLAACMRPDNGGHPALPPPTAEDDWTAVIELANRHLLSPTLYARLRQSGRHRNLPPDALDYLAMLYALNAERNTALRRQIEEIVRVLNAVGVEPMLLKGAIILFDPPGDSMDESTRMMRDLDILVPKEDSGRSIAGLKSLSYDALTTYPPGHHAIADFACAGNVGAADLHIELIDPHYILPAREVWQQAERLPIRELRILVPSSTHRILHHLLHAQVHHLANYYRGDIVLSQLFELTALEKRMRDRIDWRAIAKRMQKHRLRSVLHSYLIAANRLFAMPWPLETPPDPAAEFHFRRCLLHIRWPQLSPLAVPWGNFRAAFAWHRMRALYGSHRWLLVNQSRHALQCLQKMPVRQVLSRVFRTE